MDRRQAEAIMQNWNEHGVIPDDDEESAVLAALAAAAPAPVKPVCYWHEPMSEEIARRVLGSSHFDWIVAKGAAQCAVRANGAWQANLPESYGAYRTAERIARGV